MSNDKMRAERDQVEQDYKDVVGTIELRDIQIAALRAEIAGLKTGYKAYERVNAELKAESEALRKLVTDTALELRKASGWICREVEAGTKSATHWAIRLREKADQIDAAMGHGDKP